MLNTIIEPTTLDAAQDRFPHITFTPVAYAGDLGPCTGCAPDDGQNDSVATLNYRWWGRPTRQDVCGLCLESEIECLLKRTDAATRLKVEIPVVCELRAVA